MEPDAVEAPGAAPTEAAPSANETFEQKMDRLGGYGSDEPEVEPGESAPEPKKAAPGKKAVTPGGDKVQTLKELAKELGYEFSGDKVSIKERAEFRDAKRKHQEQLTQREQQMLQKLQEATGAAEKDISWAKELKAAKETGDYQKIATLLEAKDWEDLQKHVIAQLSDPNYKKLRELEAWKEEQAKREEEAKTNAQREAEERQRYEAQRVYRTQLTDTMKASKHPLVAAMHDDPLFLNAVMGIQGENWDGETTVTPEQALRMGLKGTDRNLEGDLENLWKRLNPYFSKKAQPEEKNVPGKKPAPKSAPIPPSKGTGEASGNGKMTDAEWRKSFQSRMAEAIAADRHR